MSYSPSETNRKISMNNDESDEISFSLAMRLARGSVLPMVLKAVIELNILELIKKAEPNNISASEIVAQLPTNNPDAANMVDRLLRLLAAHSVLNCTTKTLPNHAGVERRYSLTPLCKFLTKNADGVSLAPTSILVQDKVMMESWNHLKEMILEGAIQFSGQYGTSIFEYMGTDPRFNKIFNEAMSTYSTIITKKILETYKGFEGVKSLVDIGGGTGTTINMIISEYPSIKGINFDLPHVVRDAPFYPGVKHVGGDMFVSVPKGDAIFLKLTIHAQTDEQSLKILKSCYEALPKNGKVIIAEYIFPDTLTSNGTDDACTVAITDIMMIVFSPGGKERTEEEFRALSKQAGFKEFKKVCCAHTMWIMELYK